MFEKILDLLQTVIGKYFIDTVISFVASGIVFLFTSDNFWIVQKLQLTGYIFLCAGISFISIQLFKWIYGKISNLVRKNIKSKDEKVKQERKQDAEIKKLWSLIDSFPPEDRDTVRYLLLNDNNTVISHPRYSYAIKCLYNSDLVISQKIKPDKSNSIFEPTEYKLKEYYYTLLKKSIEKYGKISNFEKCKEEIKIATK